MNCAAHTVQYRPNRTDIEANVKHITCNLRPEDNGLLEIAWTGPGGDRSLNRAKLFPPTQIAKIVDHVAATNSIEGQNVYMSAGMRREDVDRNKRARRHDVVSANALWLDFDQNGAANEGAKRLKALGLLPTLITRTGEYPHLRTQLWFSLTEPALELARVEQIISTLSRALGGDVSVANCDRLMRIAGTVAWPKKPGRIIEPTCILRNQECRGYPYTLNEIESVVQQNFGLRVHTYPAVNAQPTRARRLTQEERLRNSHHPGQWHTNARDYVAHLVQGGANTETILSLAPVFRRDGYTLEKTRAELLAMAEGALRKYAPRSVLSDQDLKFRRNDSGRIMAEIGNVVTALATPQFCGFDIRHDTFNDELMISEVNAGRWRAFKDQDAVTLRMVLGKRGFSPVGREMMRDALTKVGADNQFDSAQEWLVEKVPRWDGVPRIETFFSSYFSTADTPYTRAASNYLWTAMAGRVLEPGCKADMVPVLVGEQGVRKSSGVAALVPNSMLYAELDFNERDADMSRKFRGKLIMELGELRGLKTKDGESIKGIITRQCERWTPKYKEFENVYARRAVLVGTTNDREFLGDPTGERRWLPMTVMAQVNVEAIVADRDQLWAEARDMWRAGGVQWQDAEILAHSEHQAFKETDPWEEPIQEWLSALNEAPPANSDALQTNQILRAVFMFDPKAIGQREKRRVGKIMRNLGFESRDQRVNGRTIKVWSRRRGGD